VTSRHLLTAYAVVRERERGTLDNCWETNDAGIGGRVILGKRFRI
jgi:hypothetical protein